MTSTYPLGNQTPVQRRKSSTIGGEFTPGFTLRPIHGSGEPVMSPGLQQFMAGRGP
jgi:hypothetical protein